MAENTGAQITTSTPAATPDGAPVPQPAEGMATRANPLAGAVAQPNVDAAATPPSTFRDMIPDELKTEACLQNFADVPTLMKSYVHAQKMVGQGKITIPGEHASLDDLKAHVFSKMPGQASRLDDFGINKPKDVEVDDSLFNGFRESAFNAGLHPKQAQNVFDWFTTHAHKMQQQMIAEETSVEKQALVKLAEDLGDKYDSTIAQARLAIKAYGADVPGMNEFIDGGAGNNPAFIKFMAKVSGSLKEGDIDGVGLGEGGKDTASAKKEYQAIMADPKHPYRNRTHPEHDAAVAHVQELFKTIAPGQRKMG